MTIRASTPPLTAESRRLRKDVEILRGATALFAGENDPPQPLIMGFIDTMRAEGHAVESICRVLREQGCHPSSEGTHNG